MPNGTLAKYVNNKPSADRVGLVSPSVGRTACLITLSPKLLDVAEGLNYLHANYTIRGDLKGVRNVSRSFRAALITFG